MSCCCIDVMKSLGLSPERRREICLSASVKINVDPLSEGGWDERWGVCVFKRKQWVTVFIKKFSGDQCHRLLLNDSRSACVLHQITLPTTFQSWISPFTLNRKQTNSCLCHLCEIMSNLLTARQPPQSIWCLFHVSMFGFLVMSQIFKGTQEATDCFWQFHSPSGCP